MFDNNFGKCRPIFKFFHQMIRKKILYVRHKSFHLSCNMLLYYLVKFENPKNVTDFDSHHMQETVDVFLPSQHFNTNYLLKITYLFIYLFYFLVCIFHFRFSVNKSRWVLYFFTFEFNWTWCLAQCSEYTELIKNLHLLRAMVLKNIDWNSRKELVKTRPR